MIRPGSYLCVVLGDGERRGDSLESLVPVLFLLRPLGEAGGNTEGSHKETQRVGVEGVREAEREGGVVKVSGWSSARCGGHMEEKGWRRRGRKRTE